MGTLNFPVLLSVTLCCFRFHVCQGRAVLMMDERGCHLRIASVKMIDPSPERGRLKFRARELNSHCASPLESDVLPMTMMTIPLMFAQVTLKDGQASSWQSWWLKSVLLLNICKRWLCVSVCKREAQRERYSHYRWITKQALACQLWSVTVKVVNMSTRRCCGKSFILILS